MAKMTASAALARAKKYADVFWEIRRDCLPLSKFEKNKTVKELLADDPAVQIAYCKHFFEEWLSGLGRRGGERCRVLKEAEKADERKMEMYRHFRHLWDWDRYPLAGTLAMHLVLQRDLPLTREDLIHLANHLADLQVVVLACNPHAAGIVRHLRQYVEKNGVDKELSLALKRVANSLNAPDQPEDQQQLWKEAKKLAAMKPDGKAKKAASKPVATSDVQGVAAKLFAKLLKLGPIKLYVLTRASLERSQMFRHADMLAAMDADPAVQVAIVRMTADRIGDVRKEFTQFIPELDVEDPQYKKKVSAYRKCLMLEGVKTFPVGAALFMDKAFKRKLPFTADDLAFITKRLADLDIVWIAIHPYTAGLLKALEKHAADQGATPELAKQMTRLAKAMDWPEITCTGSTGSADQRRAITALRDMAAMAS